MEEKTYTKEEIKTLITTRRAWTERAILALYRYQTLDEQRTLQTQHDNRVGFNGFDSPFLSELAQRLLRKQHLTDKQLHAAQKMVGKYAGQLLRLTKEIVVMQSDQDGR